ncbi:unnamed protein product [Psylliodes chrysocephalus]|uniref:AB hydrolase-1 domain-containing protein n=1 Tax=Psylliodes chrysocephalus TaxID=3402493 RepID=A0A9P0D295_9CUCU|nr:unnamed protein product [Psylliodes chrysocephala]
MFHEKTSVLVLISLVGYCLGVKVCPTESDYNNLFSTKCSENPDAGASPKEIVDRWNISTQTEHYLVTSDGYVFLVVQCVPYIEDLSAAAVVLGHGIALNSRGYLNMKNNTLVYNLLIHKHQVYLINFRGTIFSTNTTNGISIDQFEYWTFTYEHLGLEEVAITISLAKNITNRKVVYVGFSLGTTAAFALCSLKPIFCKEALVGIVALAPVAYLDILIPSALGLLAPIWPVNEHFVKEKYNGRIMPRNENELKLYTSNSISMKIFYNERILFFGNNPGSIPWQYYPVCIINNPDAIGHNVVEHFDQNILAAQFRRFDYKDKNKNTAVYGTPDPPNYAVPDISVKVSLMTGKNDLLATEKNALKLWNNLSLSARCTFHSIDEPNFTHENFMQHEYLFEKLVNPALTIIKNMEGGICS